MAGPAAFFCRWFLIRLFNVSTEDNSPITDYVAFMETLDTLYQVYNEERHAYE